VLAGISPMRSSSRDGYSRERVDTTVVSQPNSGRYLTNLSVRWTPAPPSGGKK
jgi:hypothetical protein